jgi:hypothetical protein
MRNSDLKVAEKILPERFIDNNGCGVGEVERTGFRSQRDSEASLFVLSKDFFRQSFRFTPEYKKQVASEVNPVVGDRGLFGQISEVPLRIFGFKLPEILILKDIDQIPIVQTGPLEVAVFRGESERFDQMETGTGGGAGSGDVACILGDFRLVKNDMDRL